jgi:hypothetical protein
MYSISAIMVRFAKPQMTTGVFMLTMLKTPPVDPYIPLWCSWRRERRVFSDVTRGKKMHIRMPDTNKWSVSIPITTKVNIDN